MRRGALIILIFGVLILAAAGVGAFFFLAGGLSLEPPDGELSATSDQPIPEEPAEDQVLVVFARVDIDVGTLISDTATLLERQGIPESQYEENPGRYFNSPEEVRNKLAINQIFAGSPVLTSDVTEPGLAQQIPEADDDEPRPKAYPLEVDNLTGVADQVRAGDFIDIIMTYVYVYLVDNREFNYVSTKTLVQRAEVLRVLYPAAGTEGTDGAAAPPPGDTGGPPATDASGRPIAPEGEQAARLRSGTWVLLLAVTDQEAELLEHARGGLVTEVGAIGRARTTIVLRGTGDDEIEDTLGVSQDILFDEFGLPFPGSTRLIIENEQ